MFIKLCSKIGQPPLACLLNKTKSLRVFFFETSQDDCSIEFLLAFMYGIDSYALRLLERVIVLLSLHFFICLYLSVSFCYIIMLYEAQAKIAVDL